MPAGASRSPESAASNSSWPLPATPPSPSTSPARSSKVMSRRGVPKAPGAGSDRLLTLRITAPGSWARASGVAKLAPTIISASSRADFSAGVQVSTFLPSLRIVAVSQRLRISSSLCEM